MSAAVCMASFLQNTPVYLFENAGNKPSASLTQMKWIKFQHLFNARVIGKNNIITLVYLWIGILYTNLFLKSIMSMALSVNVHNVLV